MSSPLASARALLEPALIDNDTWAEVEARLKANTAQLWTAPGCALVTEIYGDCLHVWLGGGSLHGLLDLRPRVEETARYWGLKRITILGRLGWDRVLKRFGYVRKGDELEKML